MATIKNLYELPEKERVTPKDCIFLSTHEPCSMCLSAITWGGYDNFYYLFGYEQTRDAFNIPHDLKILQEVFACENGAYSRKNAYWKSNSIVQKAAMFPSGEEKSFETRIAALIQVYGELSDLYQITKVNNEIPLA